MLSLLTGEEVPASASLQKPVAESDIQVMANNRPELLWFDAQNGRLQVQEEALKTGLMPRLGLFVQGRMAIRD